MENVRFVFLTAKNLLEGMLEVDPAHRSTAMEIKDHPWVNVGSTIALFGFHYSVRVRRFH
jgi:serine/threonine protein kinase